MPKVRHTLLLIIVLIAPFILKFLFGPKFEMYPAIILPSGPHIKTIKEDALDHRLLEFYVQEDEKLWEQLDPVTVLSPLPEQYTSPILRREFGLGIPSSYPDRKFVKIMKTLHLLDPRNLDEVENAEIKLWLKQKIFLKSGINADKIKLSTVYITIDKKGNILNKLVEGEQIIQLN